MRKVFIIISLAVLFFGIGKVKAEEPQVSNVFFETDLREALRDISSQTKVKIVPDELVQGMISIELENVPLEKALAMILAPGGYTYRKMPDGYYLVGLASPNSPSFNLLTVTEYIKTSYILAEDVPKLLSAFFEPYLQVNKEINCLTITASPELIERFKKDLAKVDKPPRQVMIEALVVELSEAGQKSLGVTWGSMTETGLSAYSPANFDYNRTSGRGDWGVSGTITTDFIFRLNTLASKGEAKIRANPRIVTLEGKEAQIYVGKEEWYLINTGSGTQSYYSLQSIPTGVVLKITPYVSKTNEITVNIFPDVSEIVGKGATNLPVITKRTAKTSVRVGEGETIVIGGLVQEQVSESVSKVPILGSLPILGNFFKHKVSSSENKEVVIFITPYLIKAGKTENIYKSNLTSKSFDFSREGKNIRREQKSFSNKNIIGLTLDQYMEKEKGAVLEYKK